MARSRWVPALIVSTLVGSAFALAASSTAARSYPATLRMFSVVHHVSALRIKGDRHLYLSPGVYVTAVGGPFEIDAVRAADGSVALWQMARDSHGAQPIRQITPDGRVRLSRGLPNFLNVTVRSTTGKVVGRTSMPYCLSSGYGGSRVDPTGPANPTYPYYCGSRLTEATVWGIDEGWANSLDLSMRFTAPDGHYTMTLAIAPTYVQQFGIAAGDASTTLGLTVHTERFIKCGPRPCPIAYASRPGTATGPTTGPTTGQPGEGPDVASGSTAPAGVDPALGNSPDGTPDLRALPAHDLSITHEKRSGRDYLNFGATIWNAGSGPLVVEGYRDGAAPVMTAMQFIYRDGKPVSSQVTGQFEFDTRRGHHHWHMEDIAQYDLLDASGNRLVLSDKQSFCLAPTDAIDLTLPGAEWQPDQLGLWSACAGDTSIWLREVLPAGWGDTYYQDVAGQSFDITGLRNGHYQLRVTADPADHLIETSYDNNVGLLPITLGGTPGHRTVTAG